MKRAVLALLLLAGICWTRAAEPFVEVPVGAAGRLGPGVAAFLPAGLDADRLPPSFALQQPLRLAEPLAGNWVLQPRFSRSPSQTRAVLRLPPGASLYGTGEVTGPLLRNGRSVELWNTDNMNYRKNDGRSLYQSHPWVLGVRPDGTAFGVIADSTWRATLSLGGEIEFTSAGPLFPVIVIDRESPQAVLHGLAELTGTTPLPPRWALGYQQCRYSYHPDTRVREIADEFRRRRIPCDVIWMDIDYMDGYRVFTFSPREFPDPAGLNDQLHARGFKTVWMIDPGVKAEPGYAAYDSGTVADVWTHTAKDTAYVGSVWPGPCVFPDFTRPETRAWWAGLYRDFIGRGIDGVWNDMNEPGITDGPGGTMPVDNWHRGGAGLPAGPHAAYHNVYGMLMAGATRDGLLAARPDRRPFVLTRANFLGGQRYAATWTGDNGSTWDFLKESIPMTLNLGLSGQPFNGPDLGGFSGTATPELWAHWVAVGSLFPFSRGHASKKSPAKEPWAFGPEVEAVARTALERRYRLLPYYYTLFEESSRSGQPVMRPVFFADPRDSRLRAEEQAFLIGDDLLVVPKWAERPELPAGIWRTVSLVGENSPTDTYQPDLRIRGGAIIPLGRVVQSTAEPSLDPLTLLVCLDEHGRASGRLYEDEGDGYAYRQGDYLLTTYEAHREGTKVIVTVASAAGRRPRPHREIVVEVVGETGVFKGRGFDGDAIAVDGLAR